MEVALYIAVMLIAIAVVVVILLQVKGGGIGEMLSGEGSGISRTRRGLEKTLFNVTVVLGFMFLLVSILAASYFVAN
ncbi:MAG TPA: preprotein translocase subunit SecG [Candidatus Limnocylindrales bacterium]|nr:preprotein translocase subunit SecG [Candidatus Limnocylindrales bacterium]